MQMLAQRLDKKPVSSPVLPTLVPPTLLPLLPLKIPRPSSSLPTPHQVGAGAQLGSQEEPSPAPSIRQRPWWPLDSFMEDGWRLSPSWQVYFFIFQALL